MPWPAPDEFCEAIQNPGSCFADEELRDGYAESNALGLPIVSTGAFASVYRFRTSNKDYAVRCFLHENRHRQERYRKIAYFVHNDSLPWTVDFDYIEEGIRVNSKWYCSNEVPEWLSQAYFRVLDFALRRTATQVCYFDMLRYLRSWVMLPNAELQTIEEFLLVHVYDRSLSDDNRVRSIYAAKQLIQIYESRLTDEVLIKDFEGRLTAALVSISQDKNCSLFLLMTCQRNIPPLQ